MGLERNCSEDEVKKAYKRQVRGDVCCSVLQCGAVCCGVLQCVAVCDAVCVAVCCNVLSALCCTSAALHMLL